MSGSVIFDGIVAVLIAVISGFFGGFWMWVKKKDSRRNHNDLLLMGLARKALLDSAKSYILRGWITVDEYEDFIIHLYKPYIELGGNGVGTRLKNELDALPSQEQWLEEKGFTNESGSSQTDPIG